MNAKAESVLHDALALPDEERAEVAAELLASLGPYDDPAEVEKAWAAEIEGRIDRAESEGFSGEDFGIIRQRLLDKYAQ